MTKELELKADSYTDNIMENWNYKSSDEIEYKVKQTWLDGYQECLNDNRWHYIEEGDIPKKKGQYYCTIKTKHYDDTFSYSARILSRGQNVHSKEWYWLDRFNLNWNEWALEKVYAWKEIVFPEDK